MTKQAIAAAAYATWTKTYNETYNSATTPDDEATARVHAAYELYITANKEAKLESAS